MNFDRVLVAALIAVVAMVVGALVYIDVIDERTHRIAFRAFEKQTGNTNNLTYEEWRALMTVSRPRSTTTTVPVFIPIR